jgi:SAM-dependent methyltransferase
MGPARHNGGMDAEAWNERYRASELVWSAGPNQFVEAELSDLSPGRALDLAAGEGRNAIWLARRGWQVTAVDFSQAGLDKGRILGEGLDIDWVCADATTWAGDTDGQGYDVCLVAYLQLAADERRAAARNGFASLRPGGTFLWIAHDSSNLTEGTGGPQDPSVLMTAEDLLTDLGGETFEVQRAGRVGRKVGDGHGEEPSATAWDCLVRLVRRR